MKRIACYGFVGSGGASLVGANYLILEQLLELGYLIDFYGNPHHILPSTIPQGDNISYNPAIVKEFAPHIGPRASKALGLVRYYWMQPKWDRAYAAAVSDAGGPEQYKLLLTLGTPPAFVLPGVPTLTWLQGAPGSELQAIRKIRSYFLRLGVDGISTYAALQVYYRIADFRYRNVLDRCTGLICGSEWSRRLIMDRFAGRVDALPYPIDLSLFRADFPASSLKRVLWLGRLDPRKRLDLFIDSMPLIQKVFPDLTFTIVGAASYARSQIRLIERLSNQCNIEYISHIERTQVPRLLSEALVLVQPSLNENFGSSVAEAAAAGVPSVIGPLNGTGDYLSQSAIVFREYTPNSVASAVIKSISRRRADFVTVTEKIRSEAESAFSPRGIANRLADIIEATCV